MQRFAFDIPMRGYNVNDRETLGDYLRERRVLLVFLRHYGCLFPSQVVASLKEASQSWKDPLDILFVSRSHPSDSEEFFRREWPQARALSDRDGHVFKSFGFQRGKFTQLFGAKALWCGMQATLQGKRVSGASSDVWQMPGYAVLDRQREVWNYKSSHIGDNPIWSPEPWKSVHKYR